MNAESKGLHTFGTATALAALIALTLGVATPAQAQYHYPASASSSGGHMANGTHPVSARGENPAAYGHSSNPLRNRNPNPSMQPGEACPIGSACGPHAPTGAGPAGSAGYDGSGAGYGQAQAPSQANGTHPTPMRGQSAAAYGHSSNPLHNRNPNPSMQPGEACPIGSRCGPHAPTGAGPAGSAGYGSGTGYGQAQTPRQTNGIHPIRAQAGDQRELLPSLAGGVNPAIGQTRNNVGNQTPTTTSYGTSNYKNGQLGSNGQSFTNGHGQKVTLGGAQSFTGPTGKKTTVGGSQSLTGSHSIGGETYGAPGNVNAQGDHTSGLHLNNGGTQSAASAPADAPDKPTGKANSGGTFSNWLDSEWGHPADGKDSQGNTWKDGNLDTGYDENGTRYSGGKVVGGTVQGYKGKEGGVGDDPDIGPQRKGGGTLVGANGKSRNPGRPAGQDPGAGGNPEGTDATTGHNGKNAGTGTYVKATNKNGQDIPTRVKPVGALDASKLQNGASDPKRDGAVTTGGGG